MQLLILNWGSSWIILNDLHCTWCTFELSIKIYSDKLIPAWPLLLLRKGIDRAHSISEMLDTSRYNLKPFYGKMHFCNFLDLFWNPWSWIYVIIRMFYIHVYRSVSVDIYILTKRNKFLILEYYATMSDRFSSLSMQAVFHRRFSFWEKIEQDI